MAKPGRKKEPTASRKFKGVPGHRPLNENEPKPQGVAKMPDWLSDKGKEIWKQSAPKLEAIGLLTEVDDAFFSMYCETWSDYFRACEMVEEHGEICYSEKGGAYQHPAVGLKNKMREQVIKIGSLFGLSPSNRAGLEVAPRKELDALESFKVVG